MEKDLNMQCMNRLQIHNVIWMMWTYLISRTIKNTACMNGVIWNPENLEAVAIVSRNV